MTRARRHGLDAFAAQQAAGGALGDLGALEEAPRFADVAPTARLDFVVPGSPVPKARARVVLTPRGKARAFTPAKTVDYERTVATYALVARQRCAAWPLGGLYAVTIEVRRIQQRGDLDNIIKSALDACNGVLWVDDAQVVEIHAARVPVTVDECLRVLVEARS